jgi:hypothetical protein
MHSATVVSGPNAGIALPNIKTFYYRNNALVSAYSAVSPTYGATVNGDQYQILYSGGQYFLGLFQLGNPAGNQNDHWATSPVCEQLGYPVAGNYLHYYDSTSTYVASKPTIVGPNDPTTGVPTTSAAIWYLGGAPSIDGYYVQTVLTGSTNWGVGLLPHWISTQNTGGGMISMSASAAVQNTITSAAPSASSPSVGYVYDVNIQVTTDGLPSDPFPVSINAPLSIARRALEPSGGATGWENDFAYRILDLVGTPLTPITLHETFEHQKLLPPWSSTVARTDPNYSNWLSYAPAAGVWKQSAASDPSIWTPSGEFIDHVWAFDSSGTMIPTPVTFASSPTPVIDISQKFFIGGDTASTFIGQCVSVGKLTYFTDHGESTGTSPPTAGTCVVGVFGNP